MTVHVKVGGAWKTAASVHNNVSGTWKTASDMPVKVNGAWKTGVLASGSFESIATITATGGETSLTFSSVPQTYKHLQIRGLYRDTVYSAQAASLVLRFNSDTGTNYAYHRIEGDGSTASAIGYANQTVVLISAAGIGDNLTPGIYGASIIDIHDYASSTKAKTVRGWGGEEQNNTLGRLAISSSLWTSTSAITSIVLIRGESAFASGSTFALYGIKGA